MNARALAACVALLAFSALGAPTARAADDPLTAALRKVVEGNIAAFNKEDVDASMSFVDTKSPDYEGTKSELATDFKDYNLTTQLVSFTLIGHDDEFAVARVKEKTTGKPGSGFADNTTDSMVIFHQENGAWKLWSQEILGVQTP